MRFLRWWVTPRIWSGPSVLFWWVLFPPVAGITLAWLLFGRGN